VTEVGDFADILRRRLFDAEPASEVLTATADKHRRLLADPHWVKGVWEATDSTWRQNWDAQVAQCYPFHPMLMNTAKQEWSQVTGFQRVRSTIRIFAASVYALQQRGLAGEWVPDLIGPGDLPLSDSAVREALLGSGLVDDERTIANYRSLAEIEVVNATDTSGTARRQDSPALRHTPAANRPCGSNTIPAPANAATAIHS
jgi:predicted AAA+ superfamily ATPase